LPTFLRQFALPAKCAILIASRVGHWRISGVGSPWNQFEPIIRSHPEYWLWLYKHWRYKPSRAMRPYPFYSNHSLQFDLEIESQEHPERAKLLGEQIREYARWRRERLKPCHHSFLANFDDPVI